MKRKLRILLGAGLLFSELQHGVPFVDAQEPSEISGYPAVRFEQTPGFFHYAALCRTATEFTAQMPPAKLPQEMTEPAVCWYVKASNIHSSVAKYDTDPSADGKLVISAHHIRFMPHSAQFADFYVDLRPEQTVLGHQSGQAYALLRSDGRVLSFRFSKLCPSCAPGTTIAPGFNPALLDEEFSLLDDSLKHFDTGWKRIRHLSSGGQMDLASRNQAAGSERSTAVRAATVPGPAGASKTAIPSVSDSDASKSAKPEISVSSYLIPAVTSGAADRGAANASNVASATPAVTGAADSGLSSAAVSAPKPETVGPAAGKASNPRFVQTQPEELKVVEIAPQTAAGMLVSAVEPVYPMAARRAKLEGKVMLRVIIGETGEVSAVGAISGPPPLEVAAVAAVRQWRYRPYLVDGQPVEVETTIEVGFALDGSDSFNRAANHP